MEKRSLESSNGPVKLSNESILKAVAAVKDGMGTNRAALEHKVSRTTLQDRLSGRIIHGTNFGPKPYLMRVEEQELVGFLLHYPKVILGNLPASSEGESKSNNVAQPDGDSSTTELDDNDLLNSSSHTLQPEGDDLSIALFKICFLFKLFILRMNPMWLLFLSVFHQWSKTVH